MTTRRPARWLRPLSECIGNNFIAKIQVPSLPEQQLPRMNTQSTHTHKQPPQQQCCPLTLLSASDHRPNTHFHPDVTHSLIPALPPQQQSSPAALTSPPPPHLHPHVRVHESACGGAPGCLRIVREACLHSRLMRYNWLRSPSSRTQKTRGKK